MTDLDPAHLSSMPSVEAPLAVDLRPEAEVITMAEPFSLERRKLMRFLGAPRGWNSEDFAVELQKGGI